ncbi:PREDICTED: probable translation initiation factor eIF-2B subunit delta [Camelina sativa]|uniref:Translation initiation factor eIF2B subunit delta n=1 Tax=Camelina sativa TaxID=90675 RepID=A0ABM0VVL1_CAMSA|nr:PREDICTED: probable translation initiation factor eIF-2B subunit delta [Camelina sativa]
MDTRRGALAVPKVRRVGFFTPTEPPPESSQRPNRSQSGPVEATTSSSPLSDSPSGNLISPVLIPPSRHHSDNLTSHAAAPVPVPGPAAFRRYLAHDRSLHVGSYNAPDSLLGTSPPSSNGEFSEDSVSLFGFQRSDSTKLSASFPNGGFDLTLAVRAPQESETIIETASASEGKKKIAEVSGKSESVTTKPQKEKEPKSLKDKTTKAERRAIQEAQRAAKAAAKGEGKRHADESVEANPGKAAKKPQPKKERPPISSSVSEKTAVAVEKEKRMDVPQTQMQYDDKSRVDKAKRRAVVEQTETKNKVELFLHLPQYERGSQLPNLSSNFFTLDTIHHAVYKVGLQHLAGDISGDNARCIAMLQAFEEAIKDYTTPPMKDLTMDLTTKINGYVSFLIECRPLSMSMGNAIRFLKNQIRKLPVNLSEPEAKASLCSDIGRFIDEKIILSDKVIVQHAVSKIRDGEVLLTYGFSCVVEMILLYAHEIGKKFRVVIVDARPNLEGKKLLRRLVSRGLDCTYTHINAISYIMREATRVFLGASSIFSNGTLYSKVGTACVAMVANAFSVPVIVCCEAYKFHERVLLDSICSNELGDPDAVANIPSFSTKAKQSKMMDNNKNLQFLNLMYDSTPSEYISMIVSDYGMIPPTSIPVIVREYRRENLLL